MFRSLGEPVAGVRRVTVLVRQAFLACALGLCLSAPPSSADDLVIEIVALRHRTAEQILPLVRPLVPNPGTVVGSQNSLIIRATPKALAEIRRIVEQIDRPARRLLITVVQDADRAEAEGSPRTRVYSTQSAASDRHAQRVQVTEGAEATIDIGQSVPVPSREIVYGVAGRRGVGHSVSSVEYRDIMSGFRVRPQLVGNRVSLEVHARHDTPGRYGRGSADVQQATTVLSGRLGEWMELGAVASGQAIELSGDVHRTTGGSASSRRILIKVDALD